MQPASHSASPVGSTLTRGASFTELSNTIGSVLTSLPAREIARVLLLDKRIHSTSAELLPKLVRQRGFPEWWPLQKAHQVESATFFDALDSPKLWRKGPNMKVLQRAGEGTEGVWQGNSMEKGSGGSWLWLSGGTDWTGFQGGYRQVSNDGLRPAWVSFRVQVANPALSSAFLVLAADTHTWGLEDIVLLFNYRGDEGSLIKRRFSVQTTPTQKGGKPAICNMSPSCSRPYDVAIHLDWCKGVLSVFIDGTEHVREEQFDVAAPVRFAALYNWRACAASAFSDLVMGPARPCLAPVPGPAAAVPHRVRCSCLSRAVSQPRSFLVGTSIGSAMWRLVLPVLVAALIGFSLAGANAPQS